MALSRQNLRRIAYLLEVAPIAGSPASQSRGDGFRTQRSLKRWSENKRTFRTCSAQLNAARKGGDAAATSTATATAAKGRVSAARTLVSDNETGASTAPARPSSAPPASSPLTAGEADMTTLSNTALNRLMRILEDAKQPLNAEKVVSEEDALKSLRVCQDLAKVFKESSNHGGQVANSSAMNLLFSSEAGEKTMAREDVLSEMLVIRSVAFRKIADTARAVMTDPKVFITPQILESYVQLKVYIGHPEDLANVFNLYASKLIPDPATSAPIRYSAPSADRASLAVPLETAQHALDAAIATRNLPLCLDIIAATVAKAAFRRRKLIQQALLPAAGVAAAPFAAYGLASQFAVFQDNLGTSAARWVGFAGIMSYVAFTGTIGLVAVATSNDQMERVVWRDGTPLRERWMRENERAMYDKVAVAWGFKDPYRRGEEEGPDWDALKELISLRGMVLDKIELMEGMS